MDYLKFCTPIHQQAETMAPHSPALTPTLYSQRIPWPGYAVCTVPSWSSEHWPLPAAWAGKKRIATTAGTLSTTNAMFVFLLIFIVLLVGALSFFPALALGPIAEFFQSIV